MASYTPTIGLEIHTELRTRTKMFCDSPNDPHAAAPNTNVCPVCMGWPGTLPVINKEAVRHVVRVGAAINATIADYSEFDRKNYFYPDLPKGYQISQYQYPLVSKGELAGVAITRIHLEEDTARSQHEGGDSSLIDFNRAGVPLMELVTEPVMHDAATAMRFAESLQLLLRTLGASEANMEKGEMRVEVNISISNDPAKLGTKVEVKNINSFRAVGRTIEYEIRRQTELLEKGERVIQETRGWDETKGETFSQRAKESSHEYRYFPDPDLPKLRLSQIADLAPEAVTASLPELPEVKRARYVALGMKAADAAVLVTDPVYATLYEAQVAQIHDSEERALATNMLLTSIRGLNPTEAELQNLNTALADMARMRKAGSVSSLAATTIIGEVLKTGQSFEALAMEKGLIQVHDEGKLRAIALEVIAEQPDAAEQVKKGKVETIRFLIGQGMKKSKGAANPQEMERLIKEALGL